MGRRRCKPEDYTSTLRVAGTKGSFETTLVSGVYYAEEAEGDLRLLSPGSSSWQNTSYTSIEQVRAEYNGYVVLFQSLEFGDFTADGDWLVMSEEALANYNEGFTPQFVPRSVARRALHHGGGGRRGGRGSPRSDVYVQQLRIYDRQLPRIIYTKPKAGGGKHVAERDRAPPLSVVVR